MTDRERLIELKAQFVENFNCGNCKPEESKCKKCLTEKEADYLLANGVIVPPCKVGDKVYYISAVGNIIENEITHIGIYCKGKHYNEQRGIKVPLFTSTFLLDTDDHYRSYEEAEKALAERIGDNVDF
jgi:hypothetical protein